MKRCLSLLGSSLLAAGFCLNLFAEDTAAGQVYTENNLKVIYLRESGSGVDEKHAAIKLDNTSTLKAGCFEDILILDVSSAEGKAMYAQLEALSGAGSALKMVSYTRDEEGDCHLKSFEK